VRAGETIEQLAFRHSNAPDRVQVVRAVRLFMVKQTIALAQSVRAELPSEIVDLASIVVGISLAGHVLEPDRVELQSTKAEHPLQRYEKFQPPRKYFAANPPPRKTVTRADSSICARAQVQYLGNRPASILENPSVVRQVRFALRLMTIAESSVRDRSD